MILYYGVDREMLNAMRVFEHNSSVIQQIEKTIENELRHIILMMPLGEKVIISPTFRFESEICRRIIARNREFLDNGYLAQYMREDSEYEFCQKKEILYRSAMNVCPDYQNAYGNKETYKKVKDVWMYRVHKKISWH